VEGVILLGEPSHHAVRPRINGPQLPLTRRRWGWPLTSNVASVFSHDDDGSIELSHPHEMRATPSKKSTYYLRTLGAWRPWRRIAARVEAVELDQLTGMVDLEVTLLLGLASCSRRSTWRLST
jgi:hypothetical protein